MKKNIFKVCSVLLGITVLTSCLKDDSMVLDPEKGTNVIEFGNSTDIAVHGSKIPLYIHSYEISNTPVTLNIPIQYSGPEATAPSDITVKVEVTGMAPVDAYNTEQHTAYIMLPTSMYTIPSLDVVIPKGQSRGFLPVQFKTNLFDLTKQYALPLRIASVSSGTISGNFGTAIYGVGAKNKYDGIYTSTGTLKLNTTTGSALYPKEIALITQNATDVAYRDNYYGLDGYVFLTATGGATYFGNWAPIFRMNPDNNVVTSVTNKFGQGTNSSNRLGQLVATGINKWTISGDSKKMEVSYELRTTAGVVQAEFTETYVYTGPR